MNIVLALSLTLAATQQLAAESWSVVARPTQHDLRSVAFVNATTGFIAGPHATLLKSTNGGASWQQEIVVYNGNLYAVCADTEITLCMGDQGAIVFRVAGMPWAEYLPYFRTAYAISGTPWMNDSSWFTASDNGFSRTFTRVAVGDEGFVEFVRSKHYHEVAGSFAVDTTLVGHTQVLVAPPTPDTLRGVAQTLYEAYVVGDSGAVIVTNDRGVTWSLKHITSRSLRAVAAPDREHAVAVGDRGSIWVTTNGGAAWIDASPPGLTTTLNGVSFADNATGVAVGNDAMILLTTDGGFTWSRQAVNTFAALRAVHCYRGDDGELWIAVGDSGVVVSTRFRGAAASYVKDADTIDFGNVPVGARATRNLAVSNTSTAYLTAAFGAPAAVFTIAPRQLIVDPSAAGSVTIAFAPTDTMATSCAVPIVTDTGWIADTVVLRGRGVAAIADFSANAVLFDSAAVGATRSIHVRNRGNVPLTAAVDFVSDSSVAVSCDSTARPGDSLQVRFTLLHVPANDLSAIAVVMTNDYRNRKDTIRVSVHTAPTRILDREPTRHVAAVYPNPLLSAARAMLEIPAGMASQAVITLSDLLGHQIVRISADCRLTATTVPLLLPPLPGGAYIIALHTPWQRVWQQVVVIR